MIGVQLKAFALRGSVLENMAFSYDKSKRPKVGVGVYIFDAAGKVLLTRRKGSHESGTWCPPGGHLEYRQDLIDCAIAEAKEEVDIDVCEIEVLGITNDIHEDEEKHYVTIHCVATRWSGVPKIMEPEYCTDVGWFDLRTLPHPLFLSNRNFLGKKNLITVTPAAQNMSWHQWAEGV